MTNISILHASDFHGSNGAFRRFVALANELRPKLCVVSGDWSGKKVTFYKSEGNGRRYLIRDRWANLVESASIQPFEAKLRDVGGYLLEYDDDEEIMKFNAREATARVNRLRQWLDFGQAELGFLVAPLVTVCGNDDDDPIDELLSTHPWTANVGRLTREVAGFDFFGLGYSNWTPWETPRELSEEAIDELLQSATRGLREPKKSIGVIHVPPWESGLDDAPNIRVLSSDRMRRVGTEPVPVGSTAVRSFVEDFQPLMVLSGHCHTSEGARRIGSTYCFNPGSLYHRGGLGAYLIHIQDGQVRRFQRFVR